VSSWFKSLFQRGPAPTGRELALPPPPPELPVPAGPEANPFDAIWERLSSPDPVETPSQALDLKPLVEGVKAHFNRNKPSPSSFPALAIRVMDLLAQADVDVHELLKTIGPDPAISAHLMKVANSVLYYRGQDVLDLRTAVMKIGVRGVGEIAAGVAGRTLFDVALRVEYETFPERWRDLFCSNMTTAFAASQFSFEQHHSRPDWVFLGGMFMDIGKTMALRSLARLIMAGQVPPDLPSAQVDALLEEVHLEIGTEALRVWGLPSHLVEICMHHHDPLVEGTEYSEEIHTLRLVDGMSRLTRNPDDPTYLDQTRHSLEALHMDRVRLRMLHRTVLEQKARVAIMFPG